MKAPVRATRGMYTGARNGAFVIGLGERLRGLRVSKGLRQDDVALAAGVTRQQIANIEGGRGNPSCETLYRLCVALDASADYLVLGKENRKR